MEIYNPMSVDKEDIKKVKGKHSVFLAGPCPRSAEEDDWRNSFLKKAESYDLDITFFSPTNLEYDKMGADAFSIQCGWEREAMSQSDIILFWVARDDEHPALTTNVELGYWMVKAPTKIMYGRPDNADKIRYLDWLYQIHIKDVLGKFPKIYNSIDNMLSELQIWSSTDKRGR